MQTPPARSKLDGPFVALALAAGTFVAAIIPRASTWTGTFRGPLVLLEEVDPYYHLRRIELALTNGFSIPDVDSYVNHPHGATIDWAPGFDLLIALVYHLASKLTTAPITPAAVGAVGVAVIGSLTAAGAALLARRWGILAAIVAGLAIAWSPAAVAYSRVGRMDHHAIEPFWLVVFCAGYVWLRRNPSAGRAAVLGAMFALSTFFWPGMAFFAAALALAFGLEGWFEGEDTGRTGTTRSAAIAYLTAAACAAVLAMTSPWSDRVVYYALSWFQPLLFATIALAFGAVSWLHRRGVEWRRAWAMGAAGAAVAVIIASVGSAGIGRGFAFLTGADPVAGTLLESRSLVQVGLAYTVSWLSLGVLLPVLWGLAAVLSARQGELDPLVAAALALGALAGLLAFMQIRFGPHCAVAAALLGAWLISRAKRTALKAGLAATVAAVLAWGVRPATLPDSMVHPYLLGGFDAVVWLRRSAPETSHFRQPTRPAEYGVAAEWIWGHWITQIGRKPNIANPLGQTPRNVQGIMDVARLFMAESDEEAFTAIERLGVRYILLSSIPVSVAELSSQAGRDPDRYVTTDATGRQTFHRPFFETFHSRLYLGGGTGAHDTAPVSRVRLVFESRARIAFMGSRPAVRIFEVVPGARLEGVCPTSPVEARAGLGGSQLVYTAAETPAEDGRFALRMPYASEGTERSIAARITVRCGATEMDVTVSEQDVLEGRLVAVRPGP